MALYRYKNKSDNSELEIDVSFSAVMKPFQILLRLATQELVVTSSENVKSIELVRDNAGAGLYVAFEIRDSISEARVIFEPEVSCRWWTLRNI
ncbi:hypothetical protein RRX38_14240 [Pseudomonas sp. DTU_2021_1001937_2_SI_NGA_ILE_001]|uniref:hypothetical protein n=1 Tax=Pseudomonas sp. DTU_2021_1001937_2_SI_NGA_ILE_001 TaxID=3077589 RepID=UPI0028FC30C2|nr:hypothetical protein [Pseudomonas sp. DTU_2021_1001937_2_SI_NGA_ILE_001]WNW12254.1 hypothetical protein RRX38_14240 [Pseudomonas sp. DTU_2021_1001937_2_SI_NGA_ILE_001]